MKAEMKYEKGSGHEYSKEGIIKKDPVKENSVSVDDGDGCEGDSKVGNKNKKKRNRRKKRKNVNSVNIENDGATCKTDDRVDINRKDSDTKASKGNAKSNCKAPEMNAEMKYEKGSGHEYSKEGIIKKDPVKENSVSVDDENGCEVDSKVGNKNKKKRNRRKKRKNVNSVNIENDGATCKTDERVDINGKDSDTKASKGNAKSNCKAPEMNAEMKYEKGSGHEYSKEGIIRKDPVTENSVSVDDGDGCDPVKENSVSVDDEDGCEVDSKVGNKTKKKRNRRKKRKNVNSVNIENDGATCKTDDRVDINRKDSDRKASKGNAGNMDYKGKDGGIDSKKKVSKKRKSKKKRVKVKSKEDIAEKCDYCGKLDEHLIKCVKCKIAKYFSIFWSPHKESCKSSSNSNDSHLTGRAEKCDYCGKLDEHLKKCAKCKIAKYCSKSCQISAWPLHKKSCKSSSNSNDSHLTGRAEKCDNCGKLDEHLMNCVKCKITKYCSLTCQISAWPLHKKSCKPPSNSNDSHLTGRDYFTSGIIAICGYSIKIRK
ncbi:uncharacterized protein DDB_G0283697-like [Octopus sinensis]|uniref:Uncharacterized protein DDB_G0283697-like n=1 Tax=Octopus sinensis TaxID=2607531 RepID=A0A7E6FHE1_9MOLL|nr:uncharacterized protein DDB_G0283697-like [Octopus sinensis]